jgi:hypothetical protein
MYYICLELHHYNAIKKIKAAIIKDLIETLKSYEPKLNCNYEKLGPGFFSFSFPHLKPGEERTLSLYLKNIKEGLEGYLKEFSTYLFFIDSIDDANSTELLQDTRKSIIHAEGVWISPRAEEGLKSVFPTIKVENNLKVVSEQDTNVQSLPSFIDLFATKASLSSVLDEFEESLNSSSEGQVICLQGNDAEGGICLARKMFEHLLPNEAPSILSLNLSSDVIISSRSISATVKALRKELPQELELNQQESVCLKNTSNDLLDFGLITKEGYSEVNSVISDHIFQDAFLQAQISIKKIGQYWFTAYGFFPAVIYVPENLSDDLKEFCSYLLEAMMKENNGLVCVISSGSQFYHYLKERWKDDTRIQRQFLPNFNALSLERELSKFTERNQTNTKIDMVQTSRFQCYLALQGFAKVVKHNSGKEIPQSLIPWQFLLENQDCFDQLEWQILYVIHLLQSFSYSNILVEYCNSVHIDSIRLSQILSKFVLWGLVADEAKLQLEIIFPDELFQLILKSRSKKIRLELVHFLWDCIQRGELRLSYDLLQLLESGRDQSLYLQAAVIFLEDCARYSSNSRIIEILESIDETKHWTKSTYLVSEVQGLKQVLEQYFLSNPKERMNEAEIRSLRIPESFKYLKSILLVSRSFELKHIDEAKKEVKDLLYKTQQGDPSRALVIAQLAFGNILIYESKLLEAKDYFSWAIQNAIDGKWLFLEFLANFGEAISLFLSGSYSRVLDLLIGDGHVIERADKERNAILSTELHFLLGRTYFEIGAYEEASDCLEQCMNWNILHEEQANVIWAWIARSQSYKGETKTALRLLDQLEENIEVACFKAEALSFLDRHSEAKAILEKYLNEQEEEAFNSALLFFNWSSGFRNLEDRLIHPPKESFLLKRFIQAFYAYLDYLCGDGESSIETLNAITRVNTLSNKDPYRYFYFHWYSQIMPPEGKEGYEDKITILGKGVKCYQEQANRIDEPKHKRSFMKNPWVMQLFEAAGKYNLI